MKVIILALAILGSASSAFAKAECAEGERKLYACTVAPRETDSLTGTFKSIAVCSEGESTSMVVERSRGPLPMAAHAASRAGDVTYKVVVPKRIVHKEGYDYVVGQASVSLNLPAGLSPRVKTVSGTLTISDDDARIGSATYSCDIVR